MSTETATVEKEEEFIPLLQFVSILYDKGHNITVESVGNGMAFACFKSKRDEEGNWHISKAEMVRRIKANLKKLPPVEPGYLSLYGFLYELSKHGVDMPEEYFSHLVANGKLSAHFDTYNRWVVPVSEVERRVQRFGAQN